VGAVIILTFHFLRQLLCLGGVVEPDAFETSPLELHRDQTPAAMRGMERAPLHSIDLEVARLVAPRETVGNLGRLSNSKRVNRKADAAVSATRMSAVEVRRCAILIKASSAVPQA